MTTVFPFHTCCFKVITRPSNRRWSSSSTSLSMKGVTCLLLVLIHVRLSRSCFGEGQVLFCLDVLQAFSPGFSSLVMALKDVGVLNSTVLHSDALSSITKLRFEGASIAGISAGAFRSLQNLTALSLIQNQLTDIDPSWFSRPEVLSELSLTGNRIRVLNRSTFEGLSNLRRLSLNKNQITEIHPDTFRALTDLTDLDLSDNRMTQVSPQVFRSLRSTRISLDGNPWDCSCEAEAFVGFLKDLQNRSLLNKPSDLTCESPPSLRGRPVWNVSVCETPPTASSPASSPPASRPPSQSPPTSRPPSQRPPASRPPSQSPPTSRPPSQRPPASRPPSQRPPASRPPTSRPPASRPPTSRPPTGTQTVRPKPTAEEPQTSSPKPASGTETSVQTKPADGSTTISSHSVTPPSPPASGTRTTPSVTATTVQNATSVVTPVTPPPPRTEINESPTPRTNPTPTRLTSISETCETFQPSSDTNTASTLIAVIVILTCLLFVACFLAVRRRQRGNKTVTPEEDGREERGGTNRGASRENMRHEESDAEAGWGRAFYGVRAKSANPVLVTRPFVTPVTDQVTSQNETTEGGDTELVKGSDVRDPPNPETVPYLSIGTNQNQNSPDESDRQLKDGQTERSAMEKVISRVSSWPLSAVQRQTRCKTTEEEEGKMASEVFMVTTPELLKEDVHRSKPGLDSGEAETDHRGGNPPDKASTRPPQATTSNQNTAFVTEDVIQNKQEKPGQTRDQRPAERSSKKSSRGSNKPGRRTEAELSSRAPSGGTSPDDETLLSGNEYAFMDLLHEVVQNNGRWTRERWRQTHRNKQRR